MNKEGYIFWLFPLVMGAIIGTQSLFLSHIQTGITGISWEAVSDLLLFLPVSVYFLWQMGVGLIDNPELYKWFLILLGIYIVGVGIHLSANQIHNVLDSLSITGNSSNAAYIWDELIGHWLIHLGLAGILYLLVKSFQVNLLGNKALYGVAGFFLGLFLAVAAIEGHSVWIYTAYSILIWLSFYKTQLTNIKLCLLFSTAGIVILLASWLLIFNAFIEPSVLIK